MPLPLIPVVIVLAGSGLSGLGLGAKGARDLARARSTATKAEKLHRSHNERHKLSTQRTDTRLAQYGRRQVEVQRTTLTSWLNWLEANERKVRRLERTQVEGIVATELDLPALRELVHKSGVLKGGAGAAVSSIVAQQVALGGVRMLAVAGTGTAISSISGAAAQSATLAWLGGGTLAAGGGGMAVGSMVMTGVGAAPALFIGGITLAVQGDKALTAAEEYVQNTRRANASMVTQIELMDRLRIRCQEVQDVVDGLDGRARSSLDELPSLDFDPERDLQAFQRTALLMAELGRVLSTPLLGPDGDLSEESLKIVEKEMP